MLSAIQDIANSSNPLKIHYSAIAYIPFMSFFNMTGLVANGYIEGGIGIYTLSKSLPLTHMVSSELRGSRGAGNSSIARESGARHTFPIQERHRRRVA